MTLVDCFYFFHISTHINLIVNTADLFINTYWLWFDLKVFLTGAVDDLAGRNTLKAGDKANSTQLWKGEYLLD